MLIMLKDKVDGEIDNLMERGQQEKKEDCSDKFFVSPIVITVR